MFLIKRSWPRFNEPYLYRNHIYVIAIIKFSNRSIQNLFNVDKGTCIDSPKLRYSKGGGLFLFVRDHISSRLLTEYKTPTNIECIFY